MPNFYFHISGDSPTGNKYQFGMIRSKSYDSKSFRSTPNWIKISFFVVVYRDPRFVDQFCFHSVTLWYNSKVLDPWNGCFIVGEKNVDEIVCWLKFMPEYEHTVHQHTKNSSPIYFTNITATPETISAASVADLLVLNNTSVNILFR